MFVPSGEAPKDYNYPKYGLFTLFFLYLSQGLALGFQINALSLTLRARGWSLGSIGALGFLLAPMLLKFLWAPLVDKFYVEKFGRRKSWIIPMQVLLIGTIALTAATFDGDVTWLLVSVFLMHLVTSTQDVAVDGLAIDILKPHALGVGNTVQVVGYKFGMVAAGGVLLSLAQKYGNNAWMFGGMAALAALPLLIVPFHKEKPVPALDPDDVAAHVTPEAKPSFAEIHRKVVHMVKRPGMGWAIAFILSYKLGEEAVQVMFKTFLQDSGVTQGQIASWIGTYGMIASTAGSLLGGVLLIRYRVWGILGVATFLRIVPLFLQWYMTQTAIDPDLVIWGTVAEHFAGGILTTVMFTFMMSLVHDKRAAGTEFTLFACLENFGRTPPALGAGAFAGAFGYPALFMTGFVCSLLSVIPWWFSRTVTENASDEMLPPEKAPAVGA